MKCPECSNEVKQGYISSSRRICWSDSADSAFSTYGSEELTKDAFFKVGKIPALRCEKCNIVIFKYN
ncbi:PF20097 family protein [Oceanobacillus iheyensis]|uniref:PF20097 family protein n=1 Tax=Oceanobacillus iheyensis TaxID=182710 RepID=UPI0036274E9D